MVCRVATSYPYRTINSTWVVDEPTHDLAQRVLGSMRSTDVGAAPSTAAALRMKYDGLWSIARTVHARSMLASTSVSVEAPKCPRVITSEPEVFLLVPIDIL